jgi:hypothetical protein
LIPEDVLINNSLCDIPPARTQTYIQDSDTYGNFEIGAAVNDGVLENLIIGLKKSYWSEIFYLSNDKDIKEFYNIVASDSFKNKLLFEAVNSFIRTHEVIVHNVSHNLVKLSNPKTIRKVSLNENII